MNTEIVSPFGVCDDFDRFECTPNHLCIGGTIMTDGEGIIQIRQGGLVIDPTQSKCPGFLEVCCKLEVR